MFRLGLLIVATGGFVAGPFMQAAPSGGIEIPLCASGGVRSIVLDLGGDEDNERKNSWTHACFTVDRPKSAIRRGRSLTL